MNKWYIMLYTEIFDEYVVRFFPLIPWEAYDLDYTRLENNDDFPTQGRNPMNVIQEQQNLGATLAAAKIIRGLHTMPTIIRSLHLVRCKACTPRSLGTSTLTRSRPGSSSPAYVRGIRMSACSIFMIGPSMRKQRLRIRQSADGSALISMIPSTSGFICPPLGRGVISLGGCSKRLLRMICYLTFSLG